MPGSAHVRAFTAREAWWATIRPSTSCRPRNGWVVFGPLDVVRGWSGGGVVVPSQSQAIVGTARGPCSSRCRNPDSSRIGLPSSRALVSLDPAFSPTTT